MNIKELNWQNINKISGITVDDSKTITPYIGQYVEILDLPDWIPAREAIKISKLPYLTISDYLPISVGSDGNYKKEYQLYFEETELIIPPWYFKLLQL